MISPTRFHEVGLVYLDNRYHDPTLGVFISVDPLVTQTGEAYIYASGNPATLSDPSGLEPCRGPSDRRCAYHNAQTGSGWQWDADSVLWAAWNSADQSVKNCNALGCESSSKNAVAGQIVAMTAGDFDDARDRDGDYDGNISDEDFAAVVGGTGRAYSPLQSWAAEWLLESGGWNSYFESMWEKAAGAAGDIATIAGIGGLVICTLGTGGACGYIAAGIAMGGGAFQFGVGVAEDNPSLQVSGAITFAAGGLSAGTQYAGGRFAMWGGSLADRSRVAAFFAVDEVTSSLAQAGNVGAGTLGVTLDAILRLAPPAS